MQTENTEKETVSTTIATKENNLKDLLTGATGTLVVLEDYEATKAKLKALATESQPKVEALVSLPDFNTEQMAEAKALRAALREPRYAVLNVVKHNTKTLNDAKASDKKRLEALTTDVTPLEDKIDEKIKTIEAKRADEKKAKEDAERERVAEINRKIADAGVKFERMLAIGKTEEDLKAFDDAVNDFESKLTEDLQEYAFEGDEMLNGVKARRNEIADRLAETKRVEEQAKENAGKAEELAKKEAELNALAEIQKREMNRCAALASLGMFFNGEDSFIKGDFNVATVEIKTDSDEVFNAKLEAIKKEMQRRVDEENKKEDLQRNFEALNTRYNAVTGENYPTLSVELSDEVLDTVREVVESKEAEFEQGKKDQLKADGHIFYSRAVQHFEEFRQEAKIETLEDGILKTELEKYINTTSEAVERLKVALYQ